jgi:hypothetical protein
MTGVVIPVLLRGIQLILDGVRERHIYVYWSHEKYKFYIETPFTQLNLRSVEHVWVEFHVAESLSHTINANVASLKTLHLPLSLFYPLRFSSSYIAIMTIPLNRCLIYCGKVPHARTQPIILYFTV